MDDAMEVQALFTSALINSSRTKKDKKVKPTDLFDRKKLEERREVKPDSPEDIRRKQRAAQEKANRLPVPLKLLQGGASGPVPLPDSP